MQRVRSPRCTRPKPVQQGLRTCCLRARAVSKNGDGRVGSAGVPARNDVSLKRVWRHTVLRQVEHQARARSFKRRAGTPALVSIWATHSTRTTPVANRLRPVGFLLLRIVFIGCIL